MNTRAVILATIACAALGCWLPSLWLPGSSEQTRSIPPLPPAAAREPAWQSLAAKVRGAGSVMQQFQAVVVGVRGHGAALAFHKGKMGDLLCEEAEELAARLAGEELGAHVADGVALLKSLRECDNPTRQAALEAWGEADPEAALGALMADASDVGVEAALIQRLAARDTDKALALLRALPVTAAGVSAQVDVWSAVLAACAERGADYALAAIQSAPRGFARGSGITSLLGKMAAQGPHAALAWRDALPPELKKSSDETVIMHKWAETDPAAALEFCRVQRLKDEYGDVGESLAAHWVEKDPEAFLQWATAQGKGRFLEIAAMKMATRDPQRAVAMAAGLSSNDPDLFSADQLRHLRSVIGQEWARQDTSAALAWARTLPSEEERAAMINGLSGYLHGLPKEELQAAAQEIGSGTQVGFQMLWEADPEEAARVFDGLPMEQRLENFRAVRNSLATEFPAAAAKLLQGVIKDFPVSTTGSKENPGAPVLLDHVAGMATTWAGRDAAAAAAWVDQLPPGEPQSTAAANVVLTWGRYDFPAAKAWAEALPAGAAREKAAEQLATLTAASGSE